MSKSTLRKRIALTATTALFAGMLTVASAPVASAHNAVGSGSNVAHATTGTVNGSLFVATENSTGPVAIVNSVAAGVYNTNALSKGLLAKDSSSGTAQTATMLAGGTLSLMATVSTAVSWSSSGGSFSSVIPHIPAGTSLYGTGNATAIPGTYTDSNTPASTGVATLWTAPTTPGTYTVSLLTGFVQTSTGTYVFPSYTSGLSPTLSGKINVTVVAASAGVRTQRYIAHVIQIHQHLLGASFQQLHIQAVLIQDHLLPMVEIGSSISP